MEGKIIVNDKIYRITKHALHRMNKRSITIEDIMEALISIKSVRRIKGKKGDIVYRHKGKNKVIIILNEERDVIITVARSNKEYVVSRHKNKKNKRQVNHKRLYGNRAKK